MAFPRQLPARDRRLALRNSEELLEEELGGGLGPKETFSHDQN
jgi:hypothetical protein